jgi:hypothetical protein
VSHIFDYPTHASPTRTETLNPALVVIQPYDVEPYQRLRRASDGTQYIFTTSANLEARYEAIFDRYPAANWGGFTGLTSLYTFFSSGSYCNWMANTFQLTHDDGFTVTLRLADPPRWHFTEGLRGRFSGTLSLIGVV